MPDAPRRQLGGIKGMSGGPVFAVARCGEYGTKFRLAGVQSAWLPESHIIRAEPIEIVVGLIDSMARQLQVDSNDRNGGR